MKRISTTLNVFLLLVFSLVQVAAYADTKTAKDTAPSSYTIDILIPKNLDSFNELQQKILEQNKNINATVSLITEINPKQKKPNSILVTVNNTIDSASNESLAYDAIIAFYISPKKYRQSLNKFLENNPSLPITAIYSTPPIERQLHLIKKITPKKTSIGILFSPENKHFALQIEKEAKKLQFNPVLQESADSNSLPKDVALLLRKSDILFAHKELGVYSAQSIRTILLSAYRQRKPVFGLSAAYTKAGVLATTHSDTTQLSLALTQHIQHFAKTASLLAPGYSKLFNVYINAQVAASLGVIIKDKDAIKQEVIQAETSQ